MYIPFLTVSSLVTQLLSPTPPPHSPSTLTLKPIHAHAHAILPGSSQPALLLHNQSTTASFYAHDYPTNFFGDDDDDVPMLAEGGGLEIRTVKRLIRRPRTRPPRITSWALSHRVKLLSSLGLNSSTADGWSAPDYSDPSDEWDDIEVIAPDMSDRQTIIALAKMTSNAYVTPDGEGWYPMDGWNVSLPFGWETEADGLRGHVFADEKNETVVISIKGTSAGVLGSGGPTAKNDKFNDNLLFSCCCARVDFSWSTVCDCYGGGYKCGQTCLEDALVSESVYATVGTNLYNNITYMYPNATIWLAGHSLGGSVSSLIALSFGAPAVTFEAPGELLPSSRLHLPLPPGLPAHLSGITHVYHTADPIPMGVCNGAYSGCYAAGFALETKCHTGESIVYDTVKVKGWSVDIRTHRIDEVIDKVLAEPWPWPEAGGGGNGGGEEDEVVHLWEKAKSLPKQAAFIVKQAIGFRTEVEAQDYKATWGWGHRGPKKGGGKDEGDDDDEWKKHGGVPKPKSEDDCVDCYKWEFEDAD